MVIIMNKYKLLEAEKLIVTLCSMCYMLFGVVGIMFAIYGRFYILMIVFFGSMLLGTLGFIGAVCEQKCVIIAQLVVSLLMIILLPLCILFSIYLLIHHFKHGIDDDEIIGGLVFLTLSIISIPLIVFSSRSAHRMRNIMREGGQGINYKALN